MSDNQERAELLHELRNWQELEVDVLDTAFKLFATYDLGEKYSVDDPLREAYAAMSPDLAYEKDSALDELLSAALTVAYDSAYAAVARALGVEERVLAGVMEAWDGQQGTRADSVTFAEFERLLAAEAEAHAEYEREAIAEHQLRTQVPEQPQ